MILCFRFTIQTLQWEENILFRFQKDRTGDRESLKARKYQSVSGFWKYASRHHPVRPEGVDPTSLEYLGGHHRVKSPSAVRARQSCEITNGYSTHWYVTAGHRFARSPQWLRKLQLTIGGPYQYVLARKQGNLLFTIHQRYIIIAILVLVVSRVIVL